MRFLFLCTLVSVTLLFCTSTTLHACPGVMNVSAGADSTGAGKPRSSGVYIAPGIGGIMLSDEVYTSIHVSGGYRFTRSFMTGLYTGFQSWYGETFYLLGLEARLMSNFQKTCPYVMLQGGHSWPHSEHYLPSGGAFLNLAAGVNIPGRGKMAFTIDLCGEVQSQPYIYRSQFPPEKHVMQTGMSTVLLRFGLIL